MVSHNLRREKSKAVRTVMGMNVGENKEKWIS